MSFGVLPFLAPASLVDFNMLFSLEVFATVYAGKLLLWALLAALLDVNSARLLVAALLTTVDAILHRRVD